MIDQVYLNKLSLISHELPKFPWNSIWSSLTTSTASLWKKDGKSHNQSNQKCNILFPKRMSIFLHREAIQDSISFALLGPLFKGLPLLLIYHFTAIISNSLRTLLKKAMKTFKAFLEKRPGSKNLRQNKINESSFTVMILISTKKGRKLFII